MDSGKGVFKAVSKEFVDQEVIKKKEGNPSRIDQIFRQGEIVDIKDSKFTIRSIDHFTGIMTIKLNPRISKVN